MPRKQSGGSNVGFSITINQCSDKKKKKKTYKQKGGRKKSEDSISLSDWLHSFLDLPMGGGG
jgi:hypothetical protein